MITLFAAKGTGSIAPQAMLAYAGAEHEIRWIDYDAKEHHSAEFLAINPRGQIPALQLDDGTIMTESAAIMLHLADCFPAAALIDKPATVHRAQTYRWIVFMATNVYEDFLRMEYPANYTLDGAAEPGVSASGAASMDRSWGILNQALVNSQALVISNSHFLVGSSLTIADIYLAMLLSWHPDRAGLANRYPSLIPAARNTLAVTAIQSVFDDNNSSI